MAKAYRFDDQRPAVGSAVSAFREEQYLRDFARSQGGAGTMKFWEITGTITKDEGGPDGITIRVESVRQI